MILSHRDHQYCNYLNVILTKNLNNHFDKWKMVNAKAKNIKMKYATDWRELYFGYICSVAGLWQLRIPICTLFKLTMGLIESIWLCSISTEQLHCWGNKLNQFLNVAYYSAVQCHEYIKQLHWLVIKFFALNFAFKTAELLHGKQVPAPTLKFLHNSRPKLQ